MQWIGALLAAGGCALLGALCARRLDARERAMEFWENALARMASAVETGGAGLPEILRAGADGGENTLAQAARLLEEKPALSQGDWLSALVWEPLLTERETAALRDALSGLFAATVGPQKKALAQAQEKWRGFARAAREAADKNRRLYCSLGFLGGAALFILLC